MFFIVKVCISFFLSIYALFMLFLRLCCITTSKCQLFIALLKSHNLIIVRKILGIRIVKSSNTTKHVFGNIQVPCNAIGKNTRSNYHNAAHRVLLESIVNKTTRQHCLITHRSKYFKESAKTLQILFKQKVLTVSFEQIIGILLVGYLISI